MVPSFPITALNRTVPWMRACLANGGYTGFGCRMSLAAITLPPTRTDFGVTALGASLTGGGGGAAEGTAPRIPPSTPPPTPPGTPPGTPPTTPGVPAIGGSSSSLMLAISLGIAFGAISLLASNWRGMTFTTFTGAAAGGGGGGGGGGGATRKLVNCVLGRESVKIRGMSTRMITTTT